MPAQCNTISLISLFQNITKFVIVGKKKKKKTLLDLEFFNSQETQNTETATQTCSIKIAVLRKTLFEVQLFWKGNDNP